MAMVGLHIPAAAPWRQDFEAELMSFPVGKHDDCCDALGLVGQLLDRMISAPVPPDPDEPMRGALEMTMAEAWEMADPRARMQDRGRRI
jgi:hypothetical protein